MGCWDETCALTNMSIHGGEEVIGFIVLNGEPICLPLVGKYNEYGCIEDIVPDFNTQYICEMFEEFLTDESWDAIWDEYTWEKDDVLTIDTVFKLVERGLSIKNPNSYLAETEPRVTFNPLMVLKNVYDKITSLDNAEKLDEFAAQSVRYFENKEKRDELFKHPLLGRGEDDEPLTPEEEKELEVVKEGLKEVLRVGMEFSHEGPIIQDNPFSWMSSSYSDTYGTHIKYFREFVGDLNEHEKEMLIRFSEFGEMFNTLRKSWTATAGKGSQTENYEEIIQLAKITIEHATEQMNRWEE